jgi:signal transduction histidine kinase/DNA-binding NarL/FixJ family response regulator
MEDKTHINLSGQDQQDPDNGKDNLFNDTIPVGQDSIPKSAILPEDPWKILVVDDEEDIHTVTKMALKGFTYKDRSIKFLHTYSAKETEQVASENPDIAVILLDVVMETNTAGLNLVKFIRDGLGNKFSQIILRTGFPGYAPEREVIISYEINDYKTKTELTAFKLFTLVMASLRAYDTLISLEQLRQGLENIVRDRTADLEQKNQRILEMDQMKTRFFANISHEFRTPLTLILGPVEDMLSHGSLNEKSRQKFETMHRNALRLLNLSNQLLDLAKLDAGKMKIELVESDIFRFLRLVAEAFVSLADHKAIKYERLIPDGSLMVHYDQDKLEKIVTNLLSNAFKFTPSEGAVRLRVTRADTRAGKGPEILEIMVSDTGPGIPADRIEKVFERFYSCRSTENADMPGTGIGLALTRELVGLQHGNIRIEPAEGGGACFTVRIPVGKEHLQEDEYIIRNPGDFNEQAIAGYLSHSLEQPSVETTEAEYIPAAEMLQLLIVEDNKDMRAHLRENLEDHYVIHEAANGAAGLEKAVEIIPDLVISDIRMPGMDGIELCKNLKADERTSHIPVIMLTAGAELEVRVTGLETGADDYITKPFSIKELQTRVRNLIQQRINLREKFSRSVSLEPKDIAITSADERFLNRIIAIIGEHLKDYQFDVTHLAELAGMSRMQLFRKIRALTGQAPSEFIRTTRLKRAAQLLDKKFGNVAEICYATGFNNLSYFSKCFRELYGVTPSEYEANPSGSVGV